MERIMFDKEAFVENCPQRANLIEWIPFKEGESVVIHNTAPNAIIEVLRAKNVQLQVLSESHVEKLAMNPGKGSLDCIILVGMEVDAEFLGGLYRKLKPDGRLIVYLHNRYGMSYLAGKTPYPSYGDQYYAAIEGKEDAAKEFSDKAGVRGRSQFVSWKALDRLLEKAGITKYHKYYLDPDGDFAVNIYSDSYLPKPGNCSRKANNLMNDKLVMFDEVLACNQAAADDMFPIFANDYLIITGPSLQQQMVRYSNDRAEQYQIKTEIAFKSKHSQILEVKKTPLHEAGVEHVRRMQRTYEILRDRYEGAFTIVPCAWDGTSCVFPFVEGMTLAECITQALQRSDKKTVFALFEQFLSKLRSGEGGNFSNYDFVFNNILIKDDKWQVIDYEWTVDEAVSAEDIAFRAAYCFALEHSDFPFDDICEILHIDKKKRAKLIEKETQYQYSVTQDKPSLDVICEQHGGYVYTRETLLRGVELSTPDTPAQIYEDKGQGFNEVQSYFVPHALTHFDEMELQLSVPVGMKKLRIDPCEEPCLIQIKRIWWNGEEMDMDKRITLNGARGRSSKNNYGEFVFATRDPNIILDLEKISSKEVGANELRVQMEIHKISLQLANTLTKSLKRIL